MAGYFYMGAYQPDRLSVIERPVDHAAKVASCLGIETRLQPGDLGYAEFSPGGKARGCNPCLVDCSAAVNVQPTTWSRIKTLGH